MGKIPPGSTLQTTALVHEAYLRLVGPVDPGWKGRSHFFGAAASAMRNILVEQARRKAAAKHGGGRQRVGLEEVEIAFEGPSEDIVALDEALSRLEAQDPRKAEIVTLRYFAGLSQAETAAVLNVSERTIQRDWRYIKAWLRKELRGGAQRERDDG
jgi:RNA polymerase sigma factor (TIGR02999 family)